MIGQIAGDTAPLVSLVVPTEGRGQAIDALVTSVQQAWLRHAETTQEKRVPSDVIEVLFVDSTDPALDPSKIASWDSCWMHVRRGTENVRQKRNQGVLEARGQWIAFVDSDCLVDLGYLTAVLVAVMHGQARAFAGRIEFRGRENKVWRVVAASRLISPESQSAGSGEVAWCAAANLIVERRLFLELGGFDESLPFRLGGDDVDLGLRLQRGGNALRILPNAIVVHPKEPWSRLRAIIPRAWRWGKVEYHLGLRHPDKLRPTPPFFPAAAITSGLACGAGAMLTGRLALLWMLPLWILTSTFLSTFMSRGRTRLISFPVRYLAGWLERVYHVGSVWEHLRAGSLRFLWEGFILERSLEDLFPDESLQIWSHLVAASLVGLLGVAILVG